MKAEWVAKIQDPQRELRKQRDRLLISGMAILAFAAWSALKTVAYMITGFSKLDQELQETGFADLIRPYIMILLLVVFVILAADILMRVYVGRAARAEALDRKSGKAYLVFCFLLLVISGWSLVYDIQNLFHAGNELLESIVTVAVSLTSLYALLEVFVSAIRVKQLKKAMETEN